MGCVFKRHVIVVAILAFTVFAERGESWWWFKAGATSQTRRFEDPVNHLAVEYPNDWRFLVGGEAAVFVLMPKNGEALAALERTPLAVALRPEEIGDLFVDLELESIQAQNTTATTLRATIVDRDERRMIVIDFQRDGGAGRLERVRHYVYAAGQVVYRLVCSAPVRQFDKYGTVFSSIAASLTVDSAPRATDKVETEVASPTHQ